VPPASASSLLRFGSLFPASREEDSRVTRLRKRLGDISSRWIFVVDHGKRDDRGREEGEGVG